MGRNPAFMYYPDDWRADGLTGCSLAARGLWHEMMNFMHGTERYGYLVANGRAIPDEIIARYCGCPVEDYRTLLIELDSVGVPRRTREGILFCSRMVKDQKKRDKWAQQKRNQRDNTSQCPQNVHPDVRPMSAVSSSSSSSSIQKQSQKIERPRLWPDGFALSEILLAHAISHGIPDPPRVWEVFENHHRGKGSRFVDGDRAWYTWVAREPQFRRTGAKAETFPSSPPIKPQSYVHCGPCDRDVTATAYKKCLAGRCTWQRDIAPDKRLIPQLESVL